MKPCTNCGEQIQDRARKCRHCKSWLPPESREVRTDTASTDPAVLRLAPPSRERALPAGAPVLAPEPTSTASRHGPSGRLSAFQVAAFLGLGSVLLVGAIFMVLRSGSAVESSGAAPTAVASAAPSTHVDASLIAHAGGPPIWPISSEETDAVFYDLVYGGRDSEISACRQFTGGYEEGLVSGTDSLDACLRPYLAALGVQGEAMDLLFQSGIIIWNATATGPFWLAEGFDYDAFGSNGGPPPYLFTPEGILDIASQWNRWDLLADAKAVSMEGQMPEIQRAYATAFGMSDSDIGFWNYGENFEYLTPVETASAWTIPLLVSLEGCHACETPIKGNFELEGTGDGSISGARFVGLCYDGSYQPNDAGDIPSGNDFNLPNCPGSEPAPEVVPDGEERIVDASCGEEYCAGVWKASDGSILFEAWGMGDYFGVITVCVEKVTVVCEQMPPQEMPAGDFEWRLEWASTFPSEGSGTYTVSMTTEFGDPVGDGSWDFEWNEEATA